ncbi:iron-containing alcohol dehydrogenase family protein [Sphingomonas sp. BIUV-7]|uniref:Iron-containing alcohol dehydrogenase family protein n=1 Tax=Sphingomonas natans TaxID=3063330 RepID=A0ABT8Y6X2_9SPHN|nr:iron-containing alcohol dehydrogenase family protein [Sphingomonas sp. BIUV-7]MDO6414063.1 iron-containing alcohol dehydrogenase family protein [Sphingomonas sp. BIUV-7]
MMLSFRHSPSPTRVSYGESCIEQIAGELKRAGCSRAVILSGRTLARSEPGVSTLKAALGDLCVGSFDGVAEHSPVSAVQALVEMLREVNADALVALGGGSAVVSARAAAIMLGEGKEASELCTVFEPGKPPRSPKLAAPKIPQFIVPTTPTTAYAKAGAAVTTGEAGRRLSLFDPKARAQAIFFDPRFFAATPAGLIRDAALDAFGAAVQGLESKSRQPIADAMLLQAIRLIRRNLALIEDAANAEPRGELMLAALMVGQGTDVTAGGLASAIGHSVGSRFHVANGVVNAIMLPHTLRFNASATEGRLTDLAEVLGVSTASDGLASGIADACAGFFASLGVPSRLRDIGIAREDLPSIRDTASGDWFYTQNPLAVTPETCLSLMEQAW